VRVRHFLDIDGAATLPTQQLALVDQAVADLVATRSMGAVHGPTGIASASASGRSFRASECWTASCLRMLLMSISRVRRTLSYALNRAPV
jgi:hypothetical protein